MPCGRPGRSDRNAAAKPLFMKVAAEQSCRSPGARGTFRQTLTHGSEGNSPTVTHDARWASADVHDAPLWFLAVLYYEFRNVLLRLVCSEIFPPRNPQNEMYKCSFFFKEKKKHSCIFVFKSVCMMSTPCAVLAWPQRAYCNGQQPPRFCPKLSPFPLGQTRTWKQLFVVSAELCGRTPPWLLQLGTVPVFSFLQSCYYSNATEKTKPQPVLNVWIWRRV